jgi:TPR repeat protein
METTIVVAIIGAVATVIAAVIASRHNRNQAGPPPSSSGDTTAFAANPSSSADPNDLFDRGRQAWNADDHYKAAQWFRAAAELGHTSAMYLLGTMHWEGKGVREDKNAAVELWRLAARHGDEMSVGMLSSLGLVDSIGDVQEVGEKYKAALEDPDWLDFGVSGDELKKRLKKKYGV